MIAKLSARERRVLLAFAFGLLPLFVVAYGARPLYRAFAERSQALVLQRELLARERAVVETAPSLTAPMAVARAALASESDGVIRSAARATAYSEFAERVRQLARHEEVLVLQTSEMPVDSIGDGLSVMRLGFRAETDLAGLTRFLRAVERAPWRMRASRIFIERTNPSQLGGSVAVSDGRQVLTFHATVEVIARLDEPASGGVR